ncbi:MAG: hypothetical protein HY549_12305 [Elusimicrobia bacterium]|nr:hypothetical protein [Elusimicrobiota bacterium]
MPPLPRRVFFATAAFSLAATTALGWGLIRVSAPTFDEPVHLASGYTALINRGKPPLNYRDHPPFGELWAALPLLWLRPALFFQSPDLKAGRIYRYADFFLYKNRVDAERLLNSARLWSLLTWSAAAGLAILEWSLRLGGMPALVFSGLFFAFCVPLYSNAALVTTDSPAAVLYFLTFWALARFQGRAVACAGILIGLAMASKFNMFVLPALATGLIAFDRRLNGGAWSASRWLAAALLALAVLVLVYGLGGTRYYIEGLLATLRRLDQGRGSFFFGRHSTTGTWLYFPAALLIKTPLPLLAASAVGVALWVRKREALWLLLPPAAYFAAASLSKVQIGYRHLLPIFPFLVVLGALGAAWAWRLSRPGRIAAALAALWCAVSVTRVYPYSLAYFNELVGGPAQGYRYLVDSNLDWGQDIKTLAEELRRRGDPAVILCYFGMADPRYYGLRYIPLGVDRSEGAADPKELKDILLAVSATHLQSTYFADKNLFSWLKERQPVYVAGHSIFLYDLSADADGRSRLAALLESSGQGGAARAVAVR